MQIQVLISIYLYRTKDIKGIQVDEIQFDARRLKHRIFHHQKNASDVWINERVDQWALLKANWSRRGEPPALQNCSFKWNPEKQPRGATATMIKHDNIQKQSITCDSYRKKRNQFTFYPFAHPSFLSFFIFSPFCNTFSLGDFCTGCGFPDPDELVDASGPLMIFSLRANFSFLGTAHLTCTSGEIIAM